MLICFINVITFLILLYVFFDILSAEFMTSACVKLFCRFEGLILSLDDVSFSRELYFIRRVTMSANKLID